MSFDRGSNSVALIGPTEAIPESASIVIIGGGVIGLSIAYHLALSGKKDIIVLERNTLGSGSSAKPLGGVRATFSDPGNILLGQRSLEAYEGFAAEFGVDIGLRQVGYLFLARSEAELAALEISTVMQNRLGGSGKMVSPADAHELSPFVDASALVGASFSPRDGFAEPTRVVHAYEQAARALGVNIYENVEVLDMALAGGAIAEIWTSHGAIRPDLVVCATGAWSERVGRMANMSLPVVPVRRQVGFTPQLRSPMPVVPFTLDLGTTLYFHNAGDGLLLGISNGDQEPGFGREFSYEWLRAFNDAAHLVAPTLANAPLEAGWAGLYENTPDHNALIGRSATTDNFLYAVGFSGHGFLQAPAVGDLIADMVLGRESFIDPGSFSADRFSRAASLNEVHII